MRAGRAGKKYVTTHTSTSPPAPAVFDFHVLVLFADDTEKDIKGIWGPYTDLNTAMAALDELRLWPLDGYWDTRRLNKFVAAKSANPPNGLTRWTWQQPTGAAITFNG